MKKCIISAISGAMAMLVAILITTRFQGSQVQIETEYEHIDFISTITSATCFVCSENGPYWGEDNVGIVDLNTFDLLYVPINRYGELIEEPAGVMQISSMMDQETERYVHATIFPDNAYACVELSGVKITEGDNRDVLDYMIANAYQWLECENKFYTMLSNRDAARLMWFQLHD